MCDPGYQSKDKALLMQHRCQREAGTSYAAVTHLRTKLNGAIGQAQQEAQKWLVREPQSSSSHSAAPGQVLVTGCGHQFHILPSYASHGCGNDQAKKYDGEFYPFGSDCVGLLSIWLAGRCCGGLGKSVLKNPNWQKPKTNQNKKNSLKCKDETKEKFEPWTLKPHPFRRKIRQLLSIVLLCLRAPSELGSSFRHSPVALLLPTREARKKTKPQQQQTPARCPRTEMSSSCLPSDVYGLARGRCLLFLLVFR